MDQRRRRRLLGKKSVRYQDDEEEKKRKKDLENLKGEEKYRYLKEQVGLLKQQEMKSKTIFEWFQQKSNVFPERVERDKIRRHYEDLFKSRSPSGSTLRRAGGSHSPSNEGSP